MPQGLPFQKNKRFNLWAQNAHSGPHTHTVLRAMQPDTAVDLPYTAGAQMPRIPSG
jgi:hypothetical protein